MQKAIYSIDKLSPNVELYYRGHTRYVSILGVIMSILVGILASVAFFYFLAMLLQRKDPFVYINDEFKNREKIQLNGNEFTFMFKITGEAAVPWPEEEEKKLFTFVPFTKLFYRDSTKTLVHKKQYYKTIKCPDNYGEVHGIEGYEKNFYYCLGTEMPVEVSGQYLNLVDGWGEFNLYIKTCKNSTENGNGCYPQEYIDKTLSGFFNAHFYSKAYYMDHFYYENPIKYTLNNDYFFVTGKYLKFAFRYIEKIVYESDSGIVFADLTTNNVVNKKLDYEVSSSLESKDMDGLFFNFIFAFNKEGVVKKYIRKYKKIQNILADTGGFIKAIIMIAQTFIGIFLFDYQKFQLYLKTHLLFNKSSNQSANKKISRIQNVRNESEINSTLNCAQIIETIKKNEIPTVSKTDSFKYALKCCMNSSKKERLHLMNVRINSKLDIAKFITMKKQFKILKFLVLNEDDCNTFKFISSLDLIEKVKKEQPRLQNTNPKLLAYMNQVVENSNFPKIDIDIHSKNYLR